MPTHKQLAHALALFRHRSFTQAAAESHLTQSAFSRSISNLEKELGVLLFEREGNTVSPTLYGETLLRRARTIVADTEELERDIRLLKGLDSGSLSVALAVYPAAISGSEALGAMTLAHPKLDYRVTVGNWEQTLDQVLTRRADLGYVATSSVAGDDRFESIPVCEHEMVLYARKGHPLAGVTNLSRNDLDQFPLVSIRVPKMLADVVPGKGRVDPLTGYLIPAVEIDDLGTARSIVASSNGFSPAVPIQIERQLESGEFILLDYRDLCLKPMLGFIMLRNRMVSPAAEVYMEHVFEIEQGLSLRISELLDKYRPRE
jgi:DNA-binding transcriptional LysR family regulator